VTVVGPRLAISSTTGLRATLVAQDAKTFKAIGMGGLTATFDVGPEPARTFTIAPPQGAPVVYTRVEGK
jgi:hypothetical protein